MLNPNELDDAKLNNDAKFDDTVNNDEPHRRFDEFEHAGSDAYVDGDAYAGSESEELTLADIKALHDELAEASEYLLTIGDFIRFAVSKLRQYDIVVAQGTTDVFAEAAAIVLHSLSLDWSADPEILPCRLILSEKAAILTLLSERIIERKPFSYLVNLSFFCNLPFYVDERVLIPRSPIAELIKQRFYPYKTVGGGR